MTFLAVIAAIAGLVSYFVAVRMITRDFAPRKTQAASVCPGCGYELAGLAEDAVCPECGMNAQTRLRKRIGHKPYIGCGFQSLWVLLPCAMSLVFTTLIVCLSDPTLLNFLWSPVLFIGVSIIAMLVCIPIIVASERVVQDGSRRHYVWLISGWAVVLLLWILSETEDSFTPVMLSPFMPGFVVLVLAVGERLILPSSSTHHETADTDS